VTEKIKKVKDSEASAAAKGQANSEPKPSRMPKNSIVFEKIIPAALVVLGLTTAGLILFAFAVIFGLVTY